jgi:hypothetical protein
VAIASPWRARRAATRWPRGTCSRHPDERRFVRPSASGSVAAGRRAVSSHPPRDALVMRFPGPSRAPRLRLAACFVLSWSSSTAPNRREVPRLLGLHRGELLAERKSATSFRGIAWVVT